MTANDFKWDQGPNLSTDDERLIDEYVRVGVPLDSLPYTEDIEDLVRGLGRDVTQDHLRDVFRRLLALRKRGVLPRVYAGLVMVPAPKD